MTRFVFGGPLATGWAVAFAAASILAHAGTAWSETGLDVPIEVRETLGVPRSGELVTTGVPVPRDANLTVTDGLRVVAPDGTPVPAQFRVTGRWGGAPADPARPIRWLLVDFLATVPAGGRATWHLTDGGDAGIAPIAVQATAGSFVVDTGATRFTVSRTSGTFVDRAESGGTDLLSTAGPDAGSLVVTAPDGTLLRSRGDARVLSSTLVASGPAMALVRKQIEFEASPLRDESGDSWAGLSCYPWLYDCTLWRVYRLRATLWQTFVRDSATVRLRVRIENPGLCVVDESGRKHCASPHSLHSLAFEDLSLHLTPATAATGWRAGDAAGATTADVVELQDSSGLDSWNVYAGFSGTWDRYPSHVSFRGYRTTAGGSLVDAGERAPGWLEVESPDATVAVALAGMARRFPAALRVAAGGESIAIGLYPGEWSVPHPIRAGEVHTEEAAFVVARGAVPGAGARAHAWIEEPLRASVPVARIVASDVLDDITPPGLSADYDRWNQVTVDPAAQPAASRRANILQTRDQFGMWGKTEAGFLPNDNEMETSTDLSKYGQYHGFLRQSLRLAGTAPEWSDVWWRTGVQALQALVDQGLLYQPDAYPGLWRGLNFAHCFHEDDERTTFPRGGGFGCDFGADVRGAIELYHLTGWEPALDFVREHADNLHTRADLSVGSLGNTFDHERVRAYASFLDTLVDAWEFSGDRKYLDRAVEIVARIDANDATILDCPCAGANRPVNAYFAGWLIRSLGRHANALVDAGESGSAALATGRRVLDEWAHWFVAKVAFEAHSPATGITELVAPYTWNTSGQNNRSPSISSYRLMAVDGLALAHAHIGDASYFEAARRMFEATMRQHFYWGDTGTWPAFTYSTINDHGKLAEFGGYYLARISGGATPTPGPTRTATPIPAPSATPSRTPGVTSTPVATPTQTQTPAATPTLTQTPAATPTRTSAPAATPAPIRLKGRVRSSGSPSDAEGVVVQLSGSAAANATIVAGARRYVFPSLPAGAGMTYTITFAKPGCSFSVGAYTVSSPVLGLTLPPVYVSCP